MAQTVKNLPANAGDWVQSLGREDPLEKGMAIRSSILAWRIPWTDWNLVGCSSWDHKELDMTEQVRDKREGDSQVSDLGGLVIKSLLS